MESDPIRQSVQQRPLQQQPLQTSQQGAPLNLGQRINPQNVQSNVNPTGVRPTLAANGVSYPNSGQPQQQQQQILNAAGISGQPIRQPPPLRRVDSQASVQGIPPQLIQRPPSTTPIGQQQQQQPLYQQFAPQQISKQPVQNQPQQQQQPARPILNPQNPSLNQLPRVPLVPNQSRPPFPSQQNSFPVPPSSQVQQQPQTQQQPFLPQQTQQIRPQNIRPQQPQQFANNQNLPNPQLQNQQISSQQPKVGQPQNRQASSNLQSQNSFERLKSPMQGRDSPDRTLNDSNTYGLAVNKDDDDDVVIGRATTPKPKPLQNQIIEEESGNRNSLGGKTNDDYRNASPRQPQPVQRTDSMRSISRPPSSTGLFQNENLALKTDSSSPMNRPNTSSPEQINNTSRDGIFRKPLIPNENTLKYKSFTTPTLTPPPPPPPPQSSSSASSKPPTMITDSHTIMNPSPLTARPPPSNIIPTTNLTNFNFTKPSNQNQQQQPQLYSSSRPPQSQNPVFTPNSQKYSNPSSISLNTILNSSSISPDQMNTNSSPTIKQQSSSQPPIQQSQFQNRSQYSTSVSGGDKVKFNEKTPSPNASSTSYGGNNDRPTTINTNNSRSIASSKKIISKQGDNDSGVDESTQGNEKHGPVSPGSPLKSPSKIPAPRPPSAASNKSRSTSKTRSLISPETPTDPTKKKIPMNKVQVGAAPSPNLKVVRSKIGSLDNAAYKPGGGQVKIETKKLDIKAAPKIAAKNEHYQPGGGDKKIHSTKLQWNAKSKIGSLENANHKPGGGDKKIETLKPDFKDKAKPKIGSKDNLKYQPGGGDVKTSIVEDKQGPIQTHKLDIKAQSKVGSLDNVKHKPGGGDIKIFDDKEYLKNVDHPITPTPPSQLWRSQTLTTSISLPAECLVLSLTTPSTPSKSKAAKSVNFSRPKSARTAYDGRALHPQPFRCY